MLVAVDGVELTYDEIGNVLSFGNRTFSWNSGRNLQKIVDGDNEYRYIYDENGIRTSKTVNGVTTYYNTKDGVILSQSNGTDTMYFQYDTSGVPLGLILNGVQYFYMTNQMGDVFAVTEADGEPVCEYVYNEWGELIYISYINENMTAVANANPIRYRGYYYDTETEYYYLQSRYYDPSICRFINADIPEIAQISKDTSTGTNLFAYCNNDPINNSDPMGYWFFASSVAVSLIAYYIISILMIISFAVLVAILGTMLSRINYSKVINVIRPLWNVPLSRIRQKLLISAALVYVVTASLSNVLTIAKADANIKAKVKRSNRGKYWSANVFANYVTIGRELTFNQAVHEIRNNRSVFTAMDYDARAVARVAGGTAGRNNGYLPCEIHRNGILGFYWHYHTYNRKGGHVYFLFWG